MAPITEPKILPEDGLIPFKNKKDHLHIAMLFISVQW